MSANVPHKPTVVLCKFCMQVIEDGQCKFCASRRASLQKPTDSTSQPKPREVISLVELGPVKSVRLTTNRMTIGRDPTNEVTLTEDPYISRYHCSITFEEGQFWIEDLGSKNGTKVNGAEILDREALQRGDIVTVGGTNFMIE